jgi:hypothetical protein
MVILFLLPGPPEMPAEKEHFAHDVGQLDDKRCRKALMQKSKDKLQEHRKCLYSVRYYACHLHIAHTHHYPGVVQLLL